MTDTARSAAEVGMGAGVMGDRLTEPRARIELRLRCANAVNGALRRGELPRLDGSIACVDCGAPADRYDHRSYYRPLDVQPVCRRCNTRRGPAEPVWLPDYTGAVGNEVDDERQRDLIALIDRGATMEEMGAALGGVTRERVRQLIWTRGLRQRWAAKKQETRSVRASELAAQRTAKYLNGFGGHRQRVVREAARRGLRVEVRGNGGRLFKNGCSIFIEGVPVAVHSVRGQPRFPGTDATLYAPDHPGYWRVGSIPGAVNVYALPDGRLAFVLAPIRTGSARRHTAYLRPDRVVTNWPGADEWADFRTVLAGSPHLSVVAGGKESA